jgi:diguanylate cyclase (GGDEF)-like protein/PAS domain S-box-containing protein
MRRLLLKRQLRRHSLVIVSALLGFAAVFVARLATPDPGQAVTFLYAIPIALLASEFGLALGLAAASTGSVLTIVWVQAKQVDLNAIGYGTRIAILFLVGTLVGQLARRRKELAEQNTRWFEMSNDLLCESSMDGHFTRLNGTWGEVLGYSDEELMEGPYVRFIHPDDLEPTLAIAGTLADGPSDIVDFENRYRAKDGSWRWLLWSARSDGDRIYAVAKDVTERKTLEAERERLLARVEAMARTDGLTGLPNRRAWDEELRREVARAARSGHALAVVLLDLDRFKDFNDEHGHQEGDRLLQEGAMAWREVLRVTDFIARYGGEEFGVLLPAASPEGAVEVVERLRQATPMGQTCSAGIAFFDPPDTPEEVLRRADAALYRAKREGRDRAVAASI